MQYLDFIHRVQEETGVNSPERAAQISRAVLETLGERLDRQTRNGVVAQLPKELKEFMLTRANGGDSYDVPEFYRRVGARAGMKYYDSAERTWKVMAVLREAIPDGEVNDILEGLPADFVELFGEAVPNRVRPKP